MKYLLAIDAGTGSVRAVLFDTKGNQIAIAQKEWIHLEEKGVPNSMSFDFTTNWKLVKKVIRKVLKGVDAKDVLALSATSMREGIVVYDKEGKELWGVANVDARANQEVKELKKKFPGIEEEFYAKSGQTFALGALPRLLWLKKHRPKLYNKVRFISMIGDWILAKLSGKIAVDPSNAGTTGIFDLQKRTWADEMARRISIKEDIFPPVYETGTPIGNVSKKAAKETGLSTRTKVVAGGGDVQLGCAGLGVVEVGDVAILGGSFWQQVVNIPKETPPPKDMSIRINPHVIHNQSQAEGITFFSGLIMRWYRDAFCELEKQEAKKSGKDVYDILQEKAKDIPVGSNGVMPIFSDVMRYGKWYHANPSFLGLSIDERKCNHITLFRSLMENAAIVSALNLKKIKKTTGIEFDEVVFAGGASKGELWCQIVSDVTGLKVKVPKITEATALGAAMSAGVGVGVYKDIKSAAKKLVKWEKTYLPNKTNHKTYKKIAKRWKQIYKAQRKLVDKGLLESMWRAPGV